VKNLTRDQAKQIYHDKYWVPSGAENLPANLQTPYFDVYIRNPAFAKKALASRAAIRPSSCRFRATTSSRSRRSRTARNMPRMGCARCQQLAIATGGGSGG
jgi:hypothetical protein